VAFKLLSNQLGGHKSYFENACNQRLESNSRGIDFDKIGRDISNVSVRTPTVLF